jgi:hypothetical protein
MAVVPLQRFHAAIGPPLCCVALFPYTVLGALLVAVSAIPFPAGLARPLFLVGMFDAILPVCLDKARLVLLEIGPLVSPFGFERALMFRPRAAFWGGLDASLACEADALVAIPFAPGVGSSRSRWVWLGDRGFRWSV